MNIYIHLEITARELDSKLLLAVLAASRGHSVIISNITEFNIGLKNKLFNPGIFHTKSLTPSDTKIYKHQKIIDNDFMITSIDEEHGLLEDDYEIFTKGRFSNESINQSSAIFGWGPKDSKLLKQIFPKHSSKIHNTGSPRADLWKPIFSEYWEVPKEIPKKPFLLVVSTMGLSNNIKPFFELVKSEKKAGYYQRDPSLFRDGFVGISEDYRLIHDFIKAIKHLSKYNNGYDIVVRPHPVENIDAWKTYLEDIPNVYVIREGSISPWVNNSFAVMQNGCTTAIEATISNKPVLSYVTFDQQYSRMLAANKIGYRVSSPKELLDKTNTLFNDVKSGLKTKRNKDIPEIIRQLMNLDNEELAAEKIIKVWESFSFNNHTGLSSWNLIKFKSILKGLNFKKKIGDVLRKLFSDKKIKLEKENEKFLPLYSQDINERIRRLVQIIGVKEKIECTFISEKTIIIKRV